MSPLHRRIVVGAAVLAACGGTSTGPGTSTTDPAQAVVEMSDVSRFTQVYQSEAPAFTSLDASLQSRYLDAGTPGLKAFLASRIGSASALAAAVRAAPALWALLVPQLQILATDATIASRIRADFATLKTLLPDAVFPPTYFVVGRLSTGGTVSDAGILIGAEFLGGGTGAENAAPNAFVKNNLRPPTEAVLIVAHEIAHIQQARLSRIFGRSNQTLLEVSLLEGGADFVSRLTQGDFINARLAAWADPREASLWADFKTQMQGTDLSRWLFNQGNATPDRPGDLGYYVGRRICEAYYNAQTDKAKALRDILGIADANAFLAASGYAAQFP